MNSPAGFRWVAGHAVDIDPWAAMWNRAALGEGIHMCIAAFVATGVAVSGLHAFGLYKDRDSALYIAPLCASLWALLPSLRCCSRSTAIGWPSR